VVPNTSAAGVRSGINTRLVAIATHQSGTAAPSTTYPYQFWADTTTGLLKQRDGANAAFVTVGTLGVANLGLATLASPTFTGTPAAPTAAAGTNSTQLATTAFVTSYAMPVLGTSQSATGTSIDFTSIPSWVKRVTVIFADLSLNGSASVLIQLGDSGGVETTGYVSTSNFLAGGSSSGATSSTAGIALVAQSTANALTGSVVFTKLSGNRWVATGVFNFANTTGITGFTAGDKSLSDTLDRIRVTNSASDTFDAGSINILYE
jgi:hypothetical protein